MRYPCVQRVSSLPTGVGLRQSLGVCIGLTVFVADSGVASFLLTGCFQSGKVMRPAGSLRLKCKLSPVRCACVNAVVSVPLVFSECKSFRLKARVWES